MIGPHELKGQPNLAEVLEAAIPLAEMGRTYTLLRNRGKHDLLRKEIAARSIQTNLLDYVCYLDQIVTEQYKNLPIHSSMSLSDIVRVCGLDIPQPNQISSAHNARKISLTNLRNDDCNHDQDTLQRHRYQTPTQPPRSRDGSSPATSRRLLATHLQPLLTILAIVTLLLSTTLLLSSNEEQSK